jgi:hypothetical protein
MMLASLKQHKRGGLTKEIGKPNEIGGRKMK